MKVIISLNGSDGAGKTTQINLLYNKNPYFIDKIGGLENYYPFKQVKNDRDWWFVKSSPEEFCDVIYASISERSRDIKKSVKPVILIDKGLFTFDARILSTLMIKGLSEESARKLMNEYKKKYNINIEEEMNIFLTLGGIEEQQEIQEQRGKYDDFDQERLSIYKKYQLLQYLEISKQIHNDAYIIVDATDSIEKINLKLNELIKIAMEKQIKIPDVKKQIIGIGGLSESGKSSSGRILMHEHDIPNLKFNYINDIICQRYGLDYSDLFKNDTSMIGTLVIDEITTLLERMYYWDIISFESLHNFGLTSRMKEICPNNFNIIFIKTSKDKRVNRNAFELNTSFNESLKQVDNKDKTKISRGASRIENIADYIIENDGSIDNLKQMLYNTVELIKGRSIIKMRNRAGGLLIENGKLLLMHRIKNGDEYYVVPGGGIEAGEDLDTATRRELKEEIGIDVQLLDDKPIMQLLGEKGIQYFTLVERIGGKIGTGKGPEFSSADYASRGTYSAEMIKIQDIVNGKINMVPTPIKTEFIDLIVGLNKDFSLLNSIDLMECHKSKKRRM